MSLGVDIEVTNRCNADCHFCPRDQTPHQGLMSPEVFDQALARTVELRVEAAARVGPENLGEGLVNLCGLGEPLLNRHTPAYVRQVREAGLRCQISSNGALLDQRRGDALLEAGLQSIWINVGTIDDDYEAVYGLPFEKTRANVLRFAEDAGDDCEVHIVLVDFKRDRDHLEQMRRFWQDQGISNFLSFEVMNRAGALFVDDMQYEAMPERALASSLLQDAGVQPFCTAPFLFLFIGYDGNYYLCCSDWKKEVPLGSVFDTTFLGVVAEKYERVVTRQPICKSCNHDPLNKLTEALRDSGGVAGDSVHAMVQGMVESTGLATSIIRTMDPEVDVEAVARRARRRIPVASLGG